VDDTTMTAVSSMQLLVDELV